MQVTMEGQYVVCVDVSAIQESGNDNVMISPQCINFVQYQLHDSRQCFIRRMHMVHRGMQ